MFDIIFIGERTDKWKDLKKKFFSAKRASSIDEAQKKSLTNMFWTVWPDIDICENFNFDYIPDEWSKDVPHLFKNGDTYDGMCLLPKAIKLSKNETDYRFFIHKKEIDIVASNPVPFDYFDIDTYEEYTAALEHSTTDMFWMGSRNIQVDKQLINNFYISHHQQIDRKQNHSFIHDADGEKSRNGVYLCSKHTPVSKREIEYRHLVHRKEWDIELSRPKLYEQFIIDTYDDYQHALEKSQTEMFWAIRSGIDTTDFDFKMHFPFSNNYDRQTNHIFLHNEQDQMLTNGVWLLSKHTQVSKKEIEYRFLVNAKEHKIVASKTKLYDRFIVDTYEDYQNAFDNSTTEMFWAVRSDTEIVDSAVFDIYFPYKNLHDQEHVFDRHKNHTFLHEHTGETIRNSVWLCSKHTQVSKKEIEYRFIVNAKEWDIVASKTKLYDRFIVDTYEDYQNALTDSQTEMFWAIRSNTEIVDSTVFNMHFPYKNLHDQEHVFDRHKNHTFLHDHEGDTIRNSVWLCSKHEPISKKEIDYRFIVNAKEHNTVVSRTVKYDKFKVDTYEDYQNAFDNSTTEMFWCIPTDIIITNDSIFETVFPIKNAFDTTYDFERAINHIYKNGKYNDGVMLSTKKSKITKKEFEYGFIIQKKDIDIEVSAPKPYDIVFISYEESNADENYINVWKQFPRIKRIHGVKGIHQAHIEAAKICTTDMFYVIDGDAQILKEYNFDYQVPRWQRDQVFVWHSSNPITGATYGYGGVKLLPRVQTLNVDTTSADMTTSISSKFNVVPQVSNITAFNTDPFSTWKSAFRECVKLASKSIQGQLDSETEERLEAWQHPIPDALYRHEAKRGAEEGRAYGEKYAQSPQDLRRINDFDWLQKKFNE